MFTQASRKWQVLVEFPNSFSWNTSLDISISASCASFFLHKRTIALINERAKGGKGWLIGERHVPFYGVSVTCRGEKLDRDARPQGGQKEKRQTHWTARLIIAAEQQWRARLLCWP